MPRQTKKPSSNGKQPEYPLDPNFDPNQEYQPDSQPDSTPDSPSNLLPDKNPDGTWDLPIDVNNPNAEHDPDPDSPSDRRPDPVALPGMGGFQFDHDKHSIKKYENLIRHTRTTIESKDPSGRVTTHKITTNRRYRSPLFGG